MIAVFCLRLATGIIACLPLLSPAQVNPRFFRTHFLTALGLASVATVFLYEEANLWLWVALIAAIVLSFVGSAVWLLEGAPGGKLLILLAIAALSASLVQAALLVRAERAYWLIIDDLASAAVLGTATTAMLIGHSYLIAPAMSLTPLYRLLAALAATLVIRMALAGTGLWLWTSSAATDNLETLLWLAVRWGIGLVGPLALAWMAWQTTKIRSTQSATGILYVVVILCFLGELTAMLLLEKLGVPV